jgi:hypothetical protein
LRVAAFYDLPGIPLTAPSRHYLAALATFTKKQQETSMIDFFQVNRTLYLMNKAIVRGTTALGLGAASLFMGGLIGEKTAQACDPYFGNGTYSSTY